MAGWNDGGKRGEERNEIRRHRKGNQVGDKVVRDGFSVKVTSE